LCIAAWQLAGHPLDLNTPLPAELMLQPQLMHHIAGEQSGVPASESVIGKWSCLTGPISAVLAVVVSAQPHVVDEL